MITTKREQAICEKYRKRDSNGYVHCYECPLRKEVGFYYTLCKSNSHYNRHTKEWEYDEVEVEE